MFPLFSMAVNNKSLWFYFNKVVIYMTFIYWCKNRVKWGCVNQHGLLMEVSYIKLLIKFNNLNIIKSWFKFKLII